MPDTHALLSPSSSERWIACPPSVRMSDGIEEKPSEYAAEGTAAHSLCEYKLREILGYEQPDIRENLDYYNKEMEDCTEEYRCSLPSKSKNDNEQKQKTKSKQLFNIYFLLNNYSIAILRILPAYLRCAKHSLKTDSFVK